jgi:peroxiredoxin
MTALRAALVAAGLAFLSSDLRAQKPQIVWSDAEKPIAEQLRTLRQVPDDARAHVMSQLATQIRNLSVTRNKLTLANNLASLSTEGDFGRDILQQVATTLGDALREQPVPAKEDQPAMEYVALAQLVRYEHVRVSLDSPQFAEAFARLEANDKSRESADFTLTDLHGNPWTLKGLRGKVVLVNFWATWCPPCRKEMPDLESLYHRFGKKGLVILAISDEDAAKVKPFIAGKNISYPILLDPGRKVNELFQVEGIPKSFLYDRNGKLVAQAIDMRTGKQFLAMLAQAGLK